MGVVHAQIEVELSSMTMGEIDDQTDRVGAQCGESLPGEIHTGQVNSRSS